MSNIFLIADTHMGHKGVTQFLNHDGTKLRPWNTTEEMDEALVSNWNSVVKQNDKVYHLGDVVINRKALATVGRCSGTKVLIKGNHDIFQPEEYLQYFKDIRAYHILDKCILSHIPIHLDSLERWDCNIHGHLHSNKVTLPTGNIDKKYLCVSVEQINYTPIPYETVAERIKQWNS